MARKQKKRKSKAKTAKGQRKTGPPKGPLPASPLELRPFEAIQHESTPEDWGSDDEDSPLSRAQEIVYEAFRLDDRRQIELAREALEVCPDCADAYVLLGEHAADLDEAIELYQQGMAAGERALGQAIFQEHADKFWSIVETRPYMRARMRLAQCLWTAGRRDEAVEHFQDMLRLNPSDSQGVRWELAGCLLELGADDELQKLLQRYDQDDTATWAYTKTLLAFRRHGDSPEVIRSLMVAMGTNRHVPGYLVGNEPLPRRPPESFSPGESDEAVIYAAEFLTGWRATPGAISWLRKSAKIGLPKPEPRPYHPFVEAFHELIDLPQDEDQRWEADICRLPAGIKVPAEMRIPGSRARPWVALVTNCSDHTIPAMEIVPQRPADELLCELMVRAMLKPMAGRPHRPGAIQVSTKKRCRAWQSQLADLDVICTYTKPLKQIDYVLEQLGPMLCEALPRREGPPATGKVADLADLSLDVDLVWQADIFRIPTWIETQGEPVRPWIILVTERTAGLIVAHDLSDRQPGPETLWQRLADAMRTPLSGAPSRPVEVQLRSEDHRRTVGPRLEEIGITCTLSDELDQLDLAFDSLQQHMVGPSPMPALVDVPGVELAQVGGYFDAAARFHQRAPWQHVPGDTVLMVACEKFDSGPWYAVVMGQSGVTLGLALYDDLDTLRMLLSGRLSDEESVRRTSALSVTFDEEFNMAVGDLEAAEQFGWPVATPEAYPCAMRVNPGRAVRPPLAWELELLEGCLRAIPEFLADGRTARRRLTVPVASGDLELVISPPEGDTS